MHPYAFILSFLLTPTDYLYDWIQIICLIPSLSLFQPNRVNLRLLNWDFSSLFKNFLCIFDTFTSALLNPWVFEHVPIFWWGWGYFDFFFFFRFIFYSFLFLLYFHYDPKRFHSFIFKGHLSCVFPLFGFTEPKLFASFPWEPL